MVRVGYFQISFGLFKKKVKKKKAWGPFLEGLGNLTGI